MIVNCSIKKPVLKYEQTSCELVICLCQLEEYETEADYSFLLNTWEKEYYSKLHYERKRKSYILGRYAAKTAVKAALNIESLTEIEIRNGIFDQPLIRCDQNENLAVSISHSDNTGIAVVFPDSLSVGIDIEKINPDKYQLLENMVKCSEKKCLGPEKVNMKTLTMLWAVKEALSKCIKTGLTLSMEFFETKNQIQAGEYFKGNFVHFIQYQYLAIEINDHIAALVYPLKSELTTEELFGLSI